MSRFFPVLIFGWLLSTPITAQVKEIRRVLILNEFGPASPAIATIDQQIGIAANNSAYQIELYSEFLETTLFPDQATQREFEQGYVRKYRDRKPDVIVAVGPEPISFMAGAHSKFFAGVPVIFCASNEELAGKPRLDSSFTGVWEAIEPAKTIDIALKLQPATTHLFVVGGSAPFDTRALAIVRQSLRPYESRLHITYLTDLDMPTLLARLKALPKHSIVLYTSVGKDAAGHRFIPATQSAPMVVAAANAPVFSLADVIVGQGEVGGYVMSYAAEGSMAGRMLSRILDGEKPGQIPIVRGADTYIFDWPALKKWGLDETKLPAGSIVLHREPDFWEVYRLYVLGAIALIVAEGLLIVALFWQRARRRGVEESLRVSETRLKEAQGIAHCGNWEWDIITGGIYWSDEMYRILGLQPQSVTPNLRLSQANDTHDHAAKLEEALQTGRPYGLEHTILRPNGEARTVVELGHPKFDSRGKPVCVAGTLLDITELRQAEQRLRESEQRFRIMADGAPVMMWISGIDKRCTDFNLGWLSFTGRRIELEMGDGWSEGVHSDDLDRCFATYIGAFDARQSFTMEYRLRRYDGHYRWVLDTGTPRFMPNGAFAGYIGSCIDINDQKTADLARREVAGRLLNAQEAERTRIARELHDSIGQSIALLLLQIPVAEEPPGAEHLGTKQLGLQELRDKLMALSTEVSHLSHQIHSSALEYLGLQHGVEELCAEFSQQSSMDVRCYCSDIPRKLDSEVALAYFRVTQEALHNIAKHSHAKSVQVSLTADTAYLELTIQDDGIGFNAEPGPQQPGLGLISMRERMHLLGGEIDVSSSPGAGTSIKAKVLLSVVRNRLAKAQQPRLKTSPPVRSVSEKASARYE